MMMNDKNILITGSTDGIGKQTAIDLASMGANIIVHGRDQHRVEDTVRQLTYEKNAGRIDGIIFDLSSLKQVKKFSGEIINKYDHIDILINNAGVYVKKKALSEDGFELTFAVNHLAHFLLTNELLPLLSKSNAGRIIHVSSMAHQNAKLDWNNLNAENYYDAYGVYSLSKLANVLFSKELALRLINTGITSNSLHPGVITTKLLAAGFNMSGATLKKGAETSVFLAASEEVRKTSGEYFSDKKKTRYHSIVDDESVREKFWNLSSEMVLTN